jgi:hypothetical protein
VTTLYQAWGSIRGSLEKACSFNEIKNIVGLAGMDLGKLSHLEQKPRGDEGAATKGQLMAGIDAAFSNMDVGERESFISILVEELLKKDPKILEQLNDYLSRHGWGVIDNRLVPLNLFDPADLAELSKEPRADLVKAAQRFHSGDLSGAITAACAAVDMATSLIYATHSLGDPSKTSSFQERCNQSLKALSVISNIQDELQNLGWDDKKSKEFAQNLKGALNQGAYVMQTLRSDMGDVHGTKHILKPLVFVTLKWAELFVRTFSKP